MSSYAVVNPATGETVKEYPEISDEELRAAIARAEEASRIFPSSTSVADRAALVRKVSELHSERRETLAEIIVREMGKPIEQALMEVDFAAMIYGFYADNAERSAAAPSGSCSGSCPGTSPTTRWPASPARTW
jgi:succinate-semialdehyde dehydrogenase / glutarate-semialdehyde dehydrogenase